MATSLTFAEVKAKYAPQYWNSIDEFEEYYLDFMAETVGFVYYTDRNGASRTIPVVDHFPELKLYEVWMEGYAATGEHGTAHLHGRALARNFAQACHIVMCERYLKQVAEQNHPEYKQYIDATRWDYDPNRLSFWACRLYPNESAARKTFG